MKEGSGGDGEAGLRIGEGGDEASEGHRRPLLFDAHHVFEQVDKDGNGHIDGEELQELFDNENKSYYFMRFCFCRWLQNQTRTTFF